MIAALLSARVGVPIALVAMAVLFAIDMSNVSGRRRSVGVNRVAVIATALFLVVVVARFVAYS